MTLTETPSIKERFLQYDDLRALDYCERRWKEAGEPTDRWQVINFLEQMLRELKDQGGYPRVLLLRKKEIQRRTYTIPQPSEEKRPSCGLLLLEWLAYWPAVSLPKG
ncbi:MAG TPA: hypothetical protein VJN92_22855 [Candidatus Acidoferrum sp.]|nr:hypothetical protein [Candidatus Acidoferrum sp.]